MFALKKINFFGILGTVPKVNISAAVSPTIRPMESIIPDSIPGIATGKTTLKIVRSFPAPKAKLASLIELSTESRASSVVLIIKGSTIITDVKVPANKENLKFNFITKK